MLVTTKKGGKKGMRGKNTLPWLGRENINNIKCHH
jgi:hypothetical protein